MPELRAAARRLGTPLLPWQVRAGRLLTELTAEGLPRWDTLAVSVPRQQGKTAFARAAITARSRRLPVQRSYGTAQTRMDASRNLEGLALQLGPDVVTRLGVGNERIAWDNGSWFEIFSPNAVGGHGTSMDFCLLDEVWTLEPHVMAGVAPARAARPHSQLLAISTMGTPESEVWNAMVERGRESVEEPDATMAYIEYAAATDEDVFNEALWPTWMPALGRTVTVEAVRIARGNLSPNEFIRAFGNRLTLTLNTVFPGEWVTRALHPAIPPPHQMVLALDVNDGPPGATLTSAHITTDGPVAVRSIDWRYGSPRWLPGFLADVLASREVLAVAADFGGPAKALQAEVTAICEAAYVPLVDRRPREFGGDCAAFYDALRSEAVLLEVAPPLVEALAAAYRKDLGELWVISRRRTSADASPLIAAIIAHGVARELDVAPRVVPAIY